jgi:tetratricopeptide (TPR) repeat protein
MQAVANQDSAATITNSYLGNLLLAQGLLEEAEAKYRLALAEDTMDHYQPVYKLGVIAHAEGELDTARTYLERALQLRSSIPIRVDMRLQLGDILADLGKPDSARHFYQLALDSAKILLGTFNDRPLFHLRVARAALRLGEPRLALEKLQTEFFLEERMFYVGQILLAMGQAHDLLDERDQAEGYYKQVFAFPTAWLDRRLAEQYLETPYHLR